jgi:hypothetical protein
MSIQEMSKSSTEKNGKPNYFDMSEVFLVPEDSIIWYANSQRSSEKRGCVGGCGGGFRVGDDDGGGSRQIYLCCSSVVPCIEGRAWTAE